MDTRNKRLRTQVNRMWAFMQKYVQGAEQDMKFYTGQLEKDIEDTDRQRMEEIEE